MKKRNFNSPVSFLLPTGIFDRIKFIAEERKISMSRFIREGVMLRLAQYDKDNIQFGEGDL